MTAIAVIATVMAVTGWWTTRRHNNQPPTDIAQFVLTIPTDAWKTQGTKK